jgi:hypothetical protein
VDGRTVTLRGRRRGRVRLPARLDALLVLGLVLLLPSPALAWGPAAHIDFGLESLRYLALAVPVIRRLLLAHADAYLYGSFLADAVVGKNRAPEPLHCHAWHVGRGLLQAAGDPLERAFAVGYVAHLAADAVAHREFVPAKMVESFEGRALRHVYWELRFDSRTLQARPAVVAEWRRVVREKDDRLDRFLAAHLHPAMLSHRASRGIFAGTMLMQRRPTWVQAAERVDRRSPFPLTGDEFEWYRRRAVDAVLAFLSDPECARTPQPDPLGSPQLAEALRLRRELRRARRRRGIPSGAWARLGPALRSAVAEGRPLGDAVREVLGWCP